MYQWHSCTYVFCAKMCLQTKCLVEMTFQSLLHHTTMHYNEVTIITFSDDYETRRVEVCTCIWGVCTYVHISPCGMLWLVGWKGVAEITLFPLCLSQCNRSMALKSLFQQLNSDHVKLGLVGSGCSVATEPTAEISQFFNIPQVPM